MILLSPYSQLSLLLSLYLSLFPPVWAQMCSDRYSADLKLGSLECEWPHSSNTVSQPAFICSFHPLCTPSSLSLFHLSVCLSDTPLTALSQAMRLIRWRFSAKAGPYQLSCLSLWQPFVFSQVEKPQSKNIWEKNREWVRERGRKKERGDWVLCMCMCLCWFLPRVSGCFCQWNNSESRWTVKIHSHINFISYVLLICPLIK